MKKATFYTLIKIKGYHHAIGVDGWQDEFANYYKHGKTWFAIDKATGYAMASASTLREAHAMASQDSRQKAIKKAINTCPHLTKQFKDAINRVEAFAI